MIRPININLNAAHPELPLVEATTFTGAPSSVFIRGVPKAVGNWSITAVSVAVTYPDNTTTARAAVESAEGVWVATIPGTATSGRTVAGFRILADGIDENGAAVTGYVLGFADFSVLSFTPVPAPGGTFWLLRYFDTMPTTPKKGDVAIVDGILKYYNGAAWLPFADLTNYYTKAETDNAIERVAAYYITYTAAGAAFPTRADLLNAQTYYSGGVVRVPTRNDYAVVLADEAHGGAEYRYIYAVADGATTGQWEAQYPIETNDYTALPNKPQINGNTLTGNKTGADLGVLDLNGGTMTGEIIFGNPGEYRVKYSEGYITVVANEVEYIIAIPTRAGTMALINNIAPAFSASNTYPVGSLVSYTSEDEEKLYRCTTAVTTAGAWTGSTNWTEATVEDVLAALRTGKADVSAIPYDRITITTGQLQDHAVQKVTLNAATTTLVLPALTDLTGKVSDFGIDVVNGYEVSGTPTAASFSLAGTIGTDYNLIVPEGEDWSEMSALAAGEMAQFYFTLSAFAINDKPTWKIVKQTVELVPVPVAP